MQRVKNPKRRDLYKTIDSERASHLSRHCNVFYSGHPHEITINNTNKSPKEVVKIIFDKLLSYGTNNKI